MNDCKKCGKAYSARCQQCRCDSLTAPDRPLSWLSTTIDGPTTVLTPRP